MMSENVSFAEWFLNIKEKLDSQGWEIVGTKDIDSDVCILVREKKKL